MRLSSILKARSFVFASALIFMGPGISQAQLIGSQPTPGQQGSTLGQPRPNQGVSIIGQPPAGQSGARPIQPNYPGTPSTGTDPVRDKLNQANREAADIDRNGIISPEEASRMPPGTPLPPNRNVNSR